jgi:hypothetical protein
VIRKERIEARVEDDVDDNKIVRGTEDYGFDAGNALFD